MPLPGVSKMRLYVVISTAGLTPAQQGVQAGHAVAKWLLAYPSFWQNEILIYAQVNSEESLLAYAGRIQAMGGNLVLYQDTDLGNFYTALATADEIAGRVIKRLPLWLPCCK